VPESVPTPTRYDGLLAALPASVAGGVAAGCLSTLSTVAGLGVGGLAAAVLVAVSLFAVPPE
jgi:hypothetical protein